MRFDTVAAGLGFLRPESDVAHLARFTITHAIRPRRIAAGALLVAHHMHDLDLVPRGEELRERVLVVGWTDQKVGNYDHDAGRTPFEQEVAGRGGEPGFSAAPEPHDEGAKINVRFTPSMKRRGVEPGSAVTCGKGGQPHRVIFAHPDISQARPERECEPKLVIAFRQRHRGARVDHHRDFDLAFGAVGANSQIVKPCVRVPIQKTQVVAGDVFAKVLRLDAGALDTAEIAASGTHSARALGAEHETVEPVEKAGLERARFEHQPSPPIRLLKDGFNSLRPYFERTSPTP